MTEEGFKKMEAVDREAEIYAEMKRQREPLVCAVHFCRDCQTDKPVSEFQLAKGKYPASPCNRCRAIRNQKYVAAGRRTKSKESPEKRLAKSMAWAARNKVKRSAHQAVTRAIRMGKLVRKPCEKCGALKVQAHHDDYTKKLDVRWLCAPCHKKEHRKYA